MLSTSSEMLLNNFQKKLCAGVARNTPKNMYQEGRIQHPSGVGLGYMHSIKARSSVDMEVGAGEVLVLRALGRGLMGDGAFCLEQPVFTGGLWRRRRGRGGGVTAARTERQMRSNSWP